MSTVIARPRKFQSKSNDKNFFMKVDINGEVHNVMLDGEILSKWDDIDEVTIGMVKYTKVANPDFDPNKPEGPDNQKLLDKEWERPEVIDFTCTQDYERRFSVAKAKAKLSQVDAIVKREFKLEVENAESLVS